MRKEKQDAGSQKDAPYRDPAREHAELTNSITAHDHPPGSASGVSGIRRRSCRSSGGGFLLIILPLLVFGCNPGKGDAADSIVSEKKIQGGFPIVTREGPARISISSMDHAGVAKVAGLFVTDIGRVTGMEPEILLDFQPESGRAVLIGTIGKNPIIDGLVEENKLDAGSIQGKWDSYLIQVMEDPWPGVEQILVIAGSDKRGTMYGMFDLSSAMGVSPWYWWADVPVEHKSSLYVLPGPHSAGEPAVKYRGIFINDEAPALSGWVHENFGSFNHEFYEHVFELILRMKGNFLWPAMWGRAFYDDDPLNPELADLYGVVIGTSHHEPMMRAHVEWSRYGAGPWNYEKNEQNLREFWREGILRMGSNESLVTVGMRGDGDAPMTRGTAIDLLERIVRDQREILEEVSGRPAEETPQVWALYKEVQEYYDQGMRVPDDVTLMLCDDNWGNVRRLPEIDSTDRPGGYGMYYHYDYVGGPRNYKWLNTNQIERVWEQMHLAYRYGVDRIWIVNVGDIKPMEFPIQFFLDLAWDPEQWPADKLPEYYRRWTRQQFGNRYADEISELLASYTRFNSRRKPELLAPQTYSLIHYREAERIVQEYNRLAENAGLIHSDLPDRYRDAFYQLVYFPILACANLNELYVTAGRNRLYAQQKRSATNELADRVETLFARDAELTEQFHTELAGGKWNHMMSQTHIGYTYWQQPEQNNMPEVARLEIPEEPIMGVAIEGSAAAWPGEDEMTVLPAFDPWHDGEHYIEVFNRGTVPFEFEAEIRDEWIIVRPSSGTVEVEEKIEVRVDWDKAPEGSFSGSITINGPGGTSVPVEVPVLNPPEKVRLQANGFVESNGSVCMEAANYSRSIDSEVVQWLEIPGLGRTHSAMTVTPVIAPSQIADGPRLEYNIHLVSKGDVTVRAYLSPTLNFHNSEGLRYAVSIDEEKPVIVNMHAGESDFRWSGWVSNNINRQDSEHHVESPGNHVLKFWYVDPGVVLQKLEVITGETARTYLGPPESHYAAGGY